MDENVNAPVSFRPMGKRRGKRKYKILETALLMLFLGMMVFAIVAPFMWMVISSISPQLELTEVPPHWIPEEPTLARYKALISGPAQGQQVPVAAAKFIHSFKNSLVISTLTTLICLVAGSMAAYAFARLPMPGRQFFMVGTLAAQMVPVIVIIIPLYLLMQQLDLMDKVQGLVLLYSGFMLPTVIWIMHSYFQTIPADLEEAAMIDGCSRLTALVRVIVPLSGPGLVAVAVFAFLSSWNEFFMALIFSASKAKTITVIVTEFTTQFGVDYGLMTTGGVIGSIPPLILAFLLQRYIVKGLTAGAVKG
ncbi:MAG: carbohydrate ABC transporter permease [Anaerolineales bacterium]|nr:carbohydrate ABC transporter permease [Anaerolineales bacterium]